ncbi:MAG: COX15/CtaA family protein [Anaerolineales bacterium]
MNRSRFTSFAWFVLVYNVAVILWGAYVRATGSGAGCGGHWPLCNGDVLPRAPAFETLIEYSHRIMSGFSLILVVLLLYWAWRLFRRGDRVRKGALTAAFLILLEALIGAGLVLFDLVGGNTSITRAVVGALHLVNTFMLLGALTLTALWSSQRKTQKLQLRSPHVALLMLTLLGVLVIGVSGAIAALGDTLFPTETLSAGIAMDLDPSTHFLVRLRLLHPVIAVAVGLYIVLFMRILQLRGSRMDLNTLGWIVSTLVLIQWLAGVVNLLMLAPVWMQILHLLLADLLWILLIIFTDASLHPVSTEAIT